MPHLGRWLQRDPIRYRGGLNLYGYVKSRPLHFLDPMGRCNCTKPGPNFPNAYNKRAIGVDYGDGGGNVIEFEEGMDAIHRFHFWKEVLDIAKLSATYPTLGFEEFLQEAGHKGAEVGLDLTESVDDVVNDFRKGLRHSRGFTLIITVEWKECNGDPGDWEKKTDTYNCFRRVNTARGSIEFWSADEPPTLKDVRQCIQDAIDFAPKHQTFDIQK